MALKKVIPKASPMNFAGFAAKSWEKRPNPPHKTADAHWLIILGGLGGECGEVMEVLKKQLRDGKLDFAKLVEELGDFGWYCGTASLLLNVREIDNRLLGVPVKTFTDPLPAVYYLHRLVGQFYRNFGCAEDITSDVIYEEGATQDLLMIINAWFNLLDLLEVTRATVYQNNIDKCNRRFPNGFSAEASINRVV